MASYMYISKVLWLGQPQIKATWVAASMLPPIAIEEFENGVAAEAVAVRDQSYGQQSSMVRVSKQPITGPQQKRSKTERPTFVEG